MDTRYDLRAIPAWVMEGFTTMVAVTSFDDSGNAFSPVAKAAVKDMVSEGEDATGFGYDFFHFGG